MPADVDLPALIASTVVFSGSSKLSQPDLVKHMLEVSTYYRIDQHALSIRSLSPASRRPHQKKPGARGSGRSLNPTKCLAKSREWERSVILSFLEDDAEHGRTRQDTRCCLTTFTSRIRTPT